MSRRSRTRRVLKWISATLCVLLAVTIVGSRWYGLTWSNSGCWGFVQWGGIGVGPPHPAGQFPLHLQWNLARRSHYWWPENRLSNASPCIVVPLWMPLFAAVLPAALLWWTDHRIQAGHCRKCGYNLTGNVSGACPECGTPITEERT
jgi:hypothetical protein